MDVCMHCAIDLCVVGYNKRNTHYSPSDDSSSEDNDGRFLGNGDTKSWTSAGQNSRIFSYRYHCRVNESPSGIISSGRDEAAGSHDVSFNSRIFRSVVASLEVFTKTYPGESAENLK